MGINTSPSTAPTLISLPELYGHSRTVYALGWNSSGSRLASGSTDKVIRLWDVINEKEHVSECKGHTGSIHQLDWDDTNSSRFASTSSDKTVRIWDIRTTEESQSTLPLSEECFDITYSRDGKFISASNKQGIFLIDARQNKVISHVPLPVEVRVYDWLTKQVLLNLSFVRSMNLDFLTLDI